MSKEKNNNQAIKSPKSVSSSLDEFVATIARLRAPDGCPWDLEQTHRSLARYLLEESYEVLEAIHLEDSEKLKEELGDLLLQIVLNSQVAKDNGAFDIQDVAEAINSKMIRRHPHVFAEAKSGETKIDSAAGVVTQWEDLKDQEKSGVEKQASAIDGVPMAMPALLQALKISEKAVRQGFEWNNIDEVWEKLHSELDELKAELAKPVETRSTRNIELELGDVLFTMVNIARWQNLNPEESLILATEKFKHRFRKMEEMSKRPLKELNFNELEDLWNMAKLAVSK